MIWLIYWKVAAGIRKVGTCERLEFGEEVQDESRTVVVVFEEIFEGLYFYTTLFLHFFYNQQIFILILSPTNLTYYI